MNPKLKKGLNITLTVLTVLLFVIGLMLVLVAFTSRQDERNNLGNVFGYTPLHVLTDSMTPEIPVGSLVIIKRQDSYKVGDVVTFISERDLETGEWILNTHEIVRIEDDNHYTRGTKTIDGERIPEDPNPVVNANIKGRVVLSIPLLGKVFEFLKSFWGFGIFIMLPLLGFFGYRVYVLIKVVVAIQKEKNPTVKQSDYERLLQEVEALKQKQQAANEDTPAAPPEE